MTQETLSQHKKEMWGYLESWNYEVLSVHLKSISILLSVQKTILHLFI